MDKTYFNFEEQLKSKKLAEAISLPNCVGPFCGFGGCEVDETMGKITLYPEPSSELAADKPFYNLFYKYIHDRILSHRISLEGFSDSENINFGCISRDGYIFASSDSNLQITLEGSKGVNQDIIIVAIHTPLSEPVENPVIFRAFWSQSSTSFYELYKKSVNIHYPKAENIKSIDLNPLTSELTFNNLENLAISAINSIITWDPATMNIVGIYGWGNNMLDQGVVENYRIIPYESKFPLEIPFNTAKESQINLNIALLERLIGNLPQGHNSLISYIDSLLNKHQNTSSSVSDALPKGSIILWYGNQSNIPYGWELCDGGNSVNDPSISKPNLMGRVAVGLSTSEGYNTPGTMGGKGTVKLEIDNMPKHRHIFSDDVNAEGKFTVNGELFPIKAPYGKSSSSSGENAGGGTTYYSTFEGGSSPFSIMPPYCVVAYIIKTI